MTTTFHVGAHGAYPAALDNYVAIVSCLAAAARHVAGGGKAVIEFSAGTYAIDIPSVSGIYQNLTVTQNMTIRGQGYHRTVLAYFPASPTNDTFHGLDIAAGVDVTVEGMQLKGPTVPGIIECTGIWHAAGGGALRMSNFGTYPSTTISWGVGGKFDGSGSLASGLVEANDCDFYAFHIAFFHHEGNNVNTAKSHWTNCRISAGIEHCLYINTGVSVRLNGCTAVKAGNYGWHLFGGTRTGLYAELNHCVTEDCPNAMLTNSKTPTFAKSCTFNGSIVAIGTATFKGCTSKSVLDYEIYDFDTTTTNLTLIGHTFAGTPTYGIRRIHGGEGTWKLIDCTWEGASTYAHISQHHGGEMVLVNPIFVANPGVYTVEFLGGVLRVLGGVSYTTRRLLAHNTNAAVDVILDRFEWATTPATYHIDVAGTTTTIRGTTRLKSPVGITSDGNATGYFEFGKEVATLASASTLVITPNASTYRITGSTTINTIHVIAANNNKLMSGAIRLIPDAGATWALGNSGNVKASAGARTVDRATVLVLDPVTATWYEESA